MSVSSEVLKYSWTPTGGTAYEIPETFSVDTDAAGDAQNFKLLYLDADGVESEITDYTVTGLEITTTATLNSGSGETLTIIRDEEFTQTKTYPTNSALSNPLLEKTVDKLTRMALQLKEKLERAVVQPASDDTASLLQFPAATDRANSFLAFDSSGDIELQDGAYPRNWNAAFTFADEEICQHGGILYKSLQADNQGNEPPAVGSTSLYWEELQLGGSGGLPNYIDDRAANYTGESGVTLSTETSSPINKDGNLKAVFASVASGAGFYQETDISEKDKNSNLQLSFYFKNDSGMDFSELDIAVIDTDGSNTLFEENVLDFAEYNPSTGIWRFSAIINTNGNDSLKVHWKANTTCSGTFQVSDVSLGAPFYYTAPSGIDSAGKMYYSVEAPSSGLNEAGDLVFDGSTNHNWSEYPDLYALKSELESAKYVIDNGDGTFYLPALIYDTGWVVNSDWTDLTLSLTHNLGVEISKLNVTFLIDTVGDGSDTVIPQQGTDTSANIGFCLRTGNTTTLTLQTGSGGLLVQSSAGSNILIDTESWYYRVIISRKDAPHDDAYAYLKSSDLKTVEFLGKQTNREDFHELFYSYKAPDANGLGPNGELCFDSAYTHNWSEFPELNADKANTGKYITDNGDDTFNMRDLVYDTGWVNYDYDFESKDITVQHDLNITQEELVFEAFYSSDPATSVIVPLHTVNNFNTSLTGKYSSGFRGVAASDNLARFHTGSEGFNIPNASGGVGVIDNADTGYLRLRVFRKDAPQPGTYAYLRTKSLATVVLGQLKNMLTEEDFPSETEWNTTTSLSNGWTGTVNYIKRAGVVFLEIVSLDGTSATAATIFTLPSTHRPSIASRMILMRSGSTFDKSAVLTIGTDGTMTVGGLTTSITAGLGQGQFPVL